MPVLNERPHTGNYILSEEDFGNRSRDNIVLASGSGICDAGTVLGQITTSKKFVPYAKAAADGSQTAVAILYSYSDATAADQVCVATTRAAEVNNNQLIWASGYSAADIATATAQLRAVGIISR